MPLPYLIVELLSEKLGESLSMKRLWKIFSISILFMIALAVGGVMLLFLQDFNRYKGLIAEQIKEVTGRDLIIAGNLNLEVSLNPVLVVEEVIFQNASWGSRPEMAKLKRLQAQVALIPLLFGRVEVKRLILIGLDMVAETDKAGRRNWVFDDGQSEEKSQKQTHSDESVLTLIAYTVHIEDMALTYKDGKTGKEIIVKLDRLTVDTDSISEQLAISMAGSYNGAAYTVDGMLGSINSLLNGKKFPLDIVVKAFGARILAKGDIAEVAAVRGLNLALSVNSPNMKKTVQALGSFIPSTKDIFSDLPTAAFRLTGNLKDSNEVYALSNLKMIVGKSDFAGAASVKLDKKPMITATLASNIVDIDEFLPPGKKNRKTAEISIKSSPGGAKEKPKQAKRIFSANPLPLSGLKAANALVSLKADTIRASGLSLRDVDATVSLKEGSLRLNPATLTFAEGKIKSSLDINAAKRTPRWMLKVDGKNINYGALLKQFDASDAVTGHLDLDVKVNGRGKSVRALMANLNGRVKVVSKGGRIEQDGLSLLNAGRSTNNVFPGTAGKVKDTAQPFDAQQLRCIFMDFRITKGMAKSQYTLIETNGFALVGEGGIDLADETIALRFDPRPKDTGAVRYLQPLTAEGTFADPLFAIETKRVLSKAALGAATAGAISSGGLALVFGAFVGTGTGAGNKTDTTDYCILAFAGKSLNPQNDSPSSSKSPGGKFVKKVKTGFGGAWKKLFGGE